MKTASSTDIKNHFGRYLEVSISEPVIVEKTGRPIAVILSFSDYERLSILEDQYWTLQSQRAEKTGYLGQKASIQFLKSR